MSNRNENLITAEEACTLDGLFARRVRRSTAREAYTYYERSSKTWQSLSWTAMAAEVARWQQALAAEGLHGGDRVAIQLRNGPEWVAFDQAALSLGLVTVPLYTDDRPENIAFILRDAEVCLLLVQDAGRWRRLAPHLADAPALTRALLLEAGDQAAALQAADPRVRHVPAWLPASGGELLVRDQADPQALASIVYTSGTTGRSKGVMLSHHNMLAVAHASLTLIDCYEQDVFLSFLPLSHTLERTGGYYVPLMAGARVAYARSIGQLGEDLQQIRPTVLIAVPRVFERVYGRIRAQLSERPAVARWLFARAVDVGWRRFLQQQGRGSWHPALLLWPLLDRLVAGKVVARLGGRVRAAVSGGAALSPEIARVFIGLGLPIIQGYGLTETAPVVSVNPPGNNIPESVGLPVRGVRLRIAANDELLVQGPGVMLGYWNNQAATAGMIDTEGWLHTGDQARIGDTGHLYITGRIKDILVLSNGEKIPPADMELAMALDPLIEQAMVVGEGRPYLAALVVLNADAWAALAAAEGWPAEDPASLRLAAAESLVLRRIRAALADFPGYAKIRRVRLLLEPWSVDSGLLTPTMKVKRPAVLNAYADAVEAMYQDGLLD